METLRRLINTECDYRMADETLDRFIALMQQVHLKDKEPLISYGKFDDNVYILKEGFIRRVHFDGLKEKTYTFAGPGTTMISYHSFYEHLPSYFQLESCGRSVVMKVSEAAVNDLAKESNDFALWFLRIAVSQLYFWEKKAAVINGTARERFEALVKNRPEILKLVSNGVIASYIGVEQSYLSRLKRQILR